MKVAVVTATSMADPDPDQAIMMAALEESAVDAHLLAWDDSDVDWSAFPLVVIRSPWNYIHYHQQFLDWVHQVASHATVVNPPDLVVWNSHKRYLLELQKLGFPVVPTLLFPARSPFANAQDAVGSRGWTDVVVKPAVSAGSFSTWRADTVDDERFRQLLTERDVLVQPWVRSVTGHGERCLVWIDGELSHAVRKEPRFIGQEESVGRSTLPISAAERELGESLMGWVSDAFLDGEPALYGRVDVAPDDSGEPMLMELELIEPSLFFRQRPESLTRFVAGVERVAAKLG